MVLLLLVYAFVAHLTHRAPNGSVSRIEQRVSETARAITDAPKVPLYFSTIMLSWMLLASVVAGLYHRRAFFTVALHRRFRSLWSDPAIGFGIYLSFLTTVSMFIVLLTAVLTLRAHVAHPEPTAGAPQSQAGEAAPQGSSNDERGAASDASVERQAMHARVQRMLRFDQRAAATLAPRTLPEMLLWIVLSFTAAFCEEHIFRGYLLSQSLAAMRRFTLPPWLASALSVLATSVLFGSLHLYEGVGGAVVIALLGAVFAVMTLALGNLRAVIVAHFLQDFLGGLTFYIAHLRHAL